MNATPRYYAVDTKLYLEGISHSLGILVNPDIAKMVALLLNRANETTAAKPKEDA